jgi:hypothetical protein
LNLPALTVARSAKLPWLPYVLPFAVFIAFLALQDQVSLRPDVEQPLRLVILTLVLWIFSRDVIDLRSTQLLGSTLLGVGVFLIWIAPDALIPGYRDSIVFQNWIFGRLRNSVPEAALASPVVLWSRILRAVALVPIIEELFWRGWLMRWLINPRFESVKLGAYRPFSFLFTAVLFASEHGPYWDVGLITGILYNAWMVRTRSLGDCILAHAVTNACLCGYVVATHRWEYWL